MNKTPERQTAPTRDEIRRDHVARYEWAARTLPLGITVIDLGCGVGYGAQLLTLNRRTIYAYDYSLTALQYAKDHYPGPLYLHLDLEGGLSKLNKASAAIAFEVLEHVSNPGDVLRRIQANTLLCSVPNEEHFPHKPTMNLHFRHYTESEFRDLLESSGWHVEEILHQKDADSEVGDDPGRTLVAKCRRQEGYEVPPPAEDVTEDDPAKGKHVAILGLGPSINTFTDRVKAMGGVSAFCDEVWGINANGNVFACDRIFHMDDVRVQERRAEAKPDSNIARMVDWLKGHPGPIYTSHMEPRYPGLVEYPLSAVTKATGEIYFNNTVAYAVAFAIYIGVGRISIFGCDYSYAHSHRAERGRGCLEYWIAIAKREGIKISLPRDTALLDTIDQASAAPNTVECYGYDGYTVTLRPDMSVYLTPRELPTADEIEARYNHEQPSSAHARKGLIQNG